METNWQQIAEWVGLLGGVLVGLRIGWLALARGYRKLGNMFGIGDLKTDLAALSQQMEFVVTELKPNGGASIRDCLNRIELRQLLSDQRQWAVFADMAMGVFETNAAGGFIRVNRKYLRITGRSLEEVKGSGWVNTIAAQVEKAGIRKTALICVGKVFGDSDLEAVSKLYDRSFSHGTRQAQK